MLALLDDRFTYLAANQAYVNAFDKNLEELIGHNVIDVFGEEFFNVSIKPHAVSCLAGNEISYQSWFEFPSYGKRFMDITYFPYRDSDNKVQGFVVRGRNMTEQKLAEEEKAKLEEQLLQSQKMEAIGQLTGGIAHDFNNILQTIVGYAHIIKKEVTEDSNVMSHITQVLKSSEKAQYLTQSLLAFSRKQIMNPKANNLNGLIQREGKLLRRLIGEDIDLKTELSDEDLIIYADFAQIEQVLMNFATNARDAMPRGGKLLIKTNQVELDNEFIQSHGYGKAGNYAHLIVSDTGVGMDEETRQNVFNPFFTTKEVDKGTGLGLSVTYGIIKQHSGYIDVESKEGEGTTFNIYLPITEKEIKAKKAVESQTISKGTETILVIEDNEDVRKLLSVVLEKSGYTVIEAVDGEDGFKKFNDNNEKLDLIISDLVMPKMDGEKVHEEVSKIRPEMKILFISGFTSDSDKVKNIIEKGYHYLLKPVMPDNLLKEVRGILDIDKG
jgi:signal transduction histidine kinase/CheY-like chemotaxis protein